MTPAVHIGPAISPQCAQLDTQITSLNSDIANLQQELPHATSTQEKESIIAQIGHDKAQLAGLNQQKTALGCP